MSTWQRWQPRAKRVLLLILTLTKESISKERPASLWIVNTYRREQIFTHPIIKVPHWLPWCTAQEISKGVSICIIEAFYVVMKIDLNFTGHYLVIANTDSHENNTFLSWKNVFFNNMVSKFQHICYFCHNIPSYSLRYDLDFTKHCKHIFCVSQTFNTPRPRPAKKGNFDTNAPINSEGQLSRI